MERETVGTFALVVISTILMALLITLSTPLGTKMLNFATSQVESLVGNTGVMDVQADDADYGTVAVHYRHEGSQADVETYKATLRIGETCLVPTPSINGYDFRLENGNESPTKIVVQNKLSEIIVRLIPKEYTMEFHTDGGTWDSGTTINLTYRYGTTYDLPSTITKDGYDFVGWFEDQGLGGEKTFRINEKDLGNKVFYAKYSLK